MPTYDYHCEANGRTVEVKHPMSERVRTWGELCALAALPLDATPAHTPVSKQLAAIGIGGVSSSAPAAMPTAPRGGCGSGGCGHSH
jgi:predicted nucleic acid-binding Zn ribbon protein